LSLLNLRFFAVNECIELSLLTLEDAVELILGDVQIFLEQLGLGVSELALYVVSK